MRLVSYNILEGLLTLADGREEGRNIDVERADAARSVVAELRPDILALNEALFCRPYQGMSIDYAKLFAFPFEAAALYDEAWGNAILSRYPIKSFKEMRVHNRGGLSTLIDTPEGLLTVASYHPHPNRASADKASDFSLLVADVTGPLIVCGDFNCVSPEDATDRSKLVAGFARFSRNPEAAAESFVESGRAVFAALSARGLRDAIPISGRSYSIPTDLLSHDKSSAMRIDHILASKEVEIVNGEVVHNAACDRASDHYPVMVEFRLRNSAGGTPA